MNVDMGLVVNVGARDVVKRAPQLSRQSQDKRLGESPDQAQLEGTEEASSSCQLPPPLKQLHGPVPQTSWRSPPSRRELGKNCQLFLSNPGKVIQVSISEKSQEGRLNGPSSFKSAKRKYLYLLGTRALRPIAGPLSPQKRFPSKEAMTGSENEEAREEAKGRGSV